MKIPASASYELIYSIVEHPHLGPLIEGYVVQLTTAGNLSLVNQRVLGINAEYYDKKLDEQDYEALKLLDECVPEYIVKKFSKVKKIRPQEFFDKHYSPELHRKFVRPHIERRISKVLELIYGKKLYIRELKNVIYRELSWKKTEASVLFHLRRNEKNTHYFATVKQDNQRIHLTKNNGILLTEQPCYLVAGGMILRFEKSFDGLKIKPFLSKSFVEVPLASEETFFKKFIIPLLEDYPVYAVGLEIETEKHVATPIVKLSTLLSGKLGLVLAFRYGQQVFPFEGGKAVSVSLEKMASNYKFVRTRRSLQWEAIKRDTLMSMGIQAIGGAEFGLPDGGEQLSILNWLCDHLDDLRKAGFEILQETKITYALEKGSLTYSWQQDQDWFDLKANVRFGEFEIPFLTLRKAILAGQTTLLLPNGTYALIPEKWVHQIAGLEEFTVQDDAIRLKRHHMGLVYELNKEAFAQNVRNVLNRAEGVTDEQVPNQFNGDLRAYQKAGFDWLVFLYRNKLGGCLADDMGLGKTVQTLALLQYVKNVRDIGNARQVLGQGNLFQNLGANATTLLVVPTSLIHNWLYEARKFTPELTFHVHAGPQRAKSPDRFQFYDVVITTYGTLRNDLSMLLKFQFEVIILDESQFIKNPLSKLAKAVYQLQAVTRLTLTGTPVENTIVDLWSQMNFSNPGLLGAYKWFQKHYVQPIEKDFDANKTDRLQSLIRPYILRRTKMQVASDLPPKTEQIVYCDMSEDQEDLYEKTKSTYRNLILDAVQKGGLNKSRIQILSGLTKLRQIANHPVLDNEDYTGDSGKTSLVQEMLRTAIEEGHKVLMFSQFVGHLNIYRKWLNQEAIEYVYLDGSTPSEERQKVVKRFQSEEIPLFLISLKAGGFGLNLTAADYVFMLDPWWNPAAEAQAIDRTHRIGQIRNVFSYRFVTNNTVEQKIIKLQERKKILSESIIKSEESYLKKIDLNDIREIFT